jgi:ribosomal protein S18 acetylase RimI-like enzyme
VTPAPPLQIRRARPADAAALTRIAHAAKRHWGYSDDLIELWRDDLTVTAEFLHAHPAYAAVQDAEIVGFYALSHEADVVEIEHLWVDPSHMGAGVGRRLFDHAVTIARGLGGAVLKIASDPNAEGFYRGRGARRAGDVASIPQGRVLPLLFFDLAATAGSP